MSRWQIPIGWQWAKTIEISSIVGGGTPSTKNQSNFIDKGVPWITPADLSGYQDEYISRGKRDLSEKGYRDSGAQLMPKDTVLFTSRAPIGYCVLAANEISTNQGFKSFVLKGGINPKYVRHYLLSSKQYAESLASGSTFKELSGNRIARLEIPVPPLNEQKRIVARIEELQARSRRAREALDTVPDLLDQLRQSILAAAFRGDLTKVWRKKQTDIEPAKELLKRIRAERRKRWEAAELEKLKAKGLTDEKLKEAYVNRRKKYKEPFSVAADALPKLPHGWCWSSIDTVAFVTKLAGFEYTKYVKYDAAGDMAVIKAENAGKYGFKRTAFSRIQSTTINHLTRSQVQGGDLLMVFVGAGVGHVARVPDNEKYFLGPNIGMIRIESKYVNDEFSELFLRSPLGFDITLSFTKAVAQPSLSMGAIREIPMIIPPLAEQKAIVAKVKASFAHIEELESRSDILLEQIFNLDQSILTKAFQGELVPQDPNDESAAILLERIRAVRSTGTSLTKRQRQLSTG